jgi:hypothetical protein
MLFRRKALPFVEEWIRVIEADDKIWDQNAFNDLARKGQQILPDDPNHYFKGARMWMVHSVWLVAASDAALGVISFQAGKQQ